MEISKFIQEAFKDGSIDKVSKGIEQLVIMMINAIGMMEQRHLELVQQLESLEEDMDVVKSFLLSKPVTLSGSTQPVTPSTVPPESQLISTPSTPPPEKVSTPQVAPPVVTDIAQAPQTKQTFVANSPVVGPSEEDIQAFRKKLLKPTPKHEKPKPQPVSIRAALMQEMKEFFGSAMKKVEKKKIDS